jgi:hypothetical protein
MRKKRQAFFSDDQAKKREILSQGSGGISTA